MNLLDRIGATNWTPLEHDTKMIRLSSTGSASVLRRQFPITPAEAITIHKSQGRAYGTVVVHIPHNRTLTRSVLYVACSRATSAAGLYLIGSSFRPPRQPNSSNYLAQELARHANVKLASVFAFLHEGVPSLDLVHS